MKQNFYIILLLALIPYAGMAQDPNSNGVELARMRFQSKQVISPSPEAAELGKYGNVPVGLFTGAPKISVPLVELKGNVLSLPVTLSYNSSGFKPEEIAPWTGLGWALNAGGVLTRSVIGEPDLSNYTIDSLPAGILNQHNYFADIKNKVKEIQPDIYYYNFMGYSGKYLVLPDGSVYKKEKNFLKFTSSGVYDEKGIKYEFGETEITAITPIDDLPGASTDLTTKLFESAWYLTKVTSPYGNEVMEFEYNTPSYSQTTLSNALPNNSITYSLTDDGTLTWFLTGAHDVLNTFYPPLVSIERKFLSKITLKRNGTTVGYIEFESAVNQRTDLGDAAFTGDRTLKKIKLFSSHNGTDVLLKQFELGYGNFGASQTASPVNFRRLKLKTVQEISPDTLSAPSKPPYTFDYYGESAIMPIRYTPGIDHWGFFNGQANLYGGSTPTLIPTVTVSDTYLGGSRGLGANREANADSAALTVLQKISYPTGGYTLFEYEGNKKASLLTGVDVPVGGLRLKKMIDYSFPDKPAVTMAYEYKNDTGLSSASTTPDPSYYELSQYQYGIGCPGTYTKHMVTISASSVIGLGSFQGSHIGYERVTEYKTDALTYDTLGKTVYHYTINGYSDVDDDLGNGDLKKQEVFDKTGKLLEETLYTYAYAYDYPGIPSRKMVTNPIQSNKHMLAYNGSISDTVYLDPDFCDFVPSGYSTYNSRTAAYTLVTNFIPQQSKQLTEQTRKVYDPYTGTYLSSTKKFTYGNALYNYPTLTEESNSIKEKIFTSVKYVGDYTVGCSPESGSMAASLVAMQALNMMAIPVEQLQYRKDSTGSNQRYISGQYTEYRSGLPEKMYLLTTKPLLSSVTQSAVSCSVSGPSIDSHYQLEAVMSYDTTYNLQEETKVNDLTTTYLWDYQARYPVAKITNAALAAVAYTSFESDGTGNWDFASVGIRSDSGFVTGSRAYRLATGNIERTALDTGTIYVLSYWLKNGGTVNINGAGGATEMMNRNGWKLYQKELHGDTAITISGSGVIDELRLHPKNAQMTTFTYEPMVGISSQCDLNNRITFYEYDVFKRLQRIRDMDKNILRSFKYAYNETQ